jgi:hypothetical protein
MWRALLVLAVVSNVAHADPCRAAPARSKSRAMQLELTGKHFKLLARKGDAEFPAVSDDGTQIAQLFEDQQDFTGAPLTTLVVWTKTGKRVMKRGLGGEGDKRDPDATLRAANELLAKHRWRPLPTFAPCDDASTLELDDITLAFDSAHEQVTAGTVTKQLGAPGDAMMGTTTCGVNTGLAEAFGGKALGIVIVVPRVNLGGDSCFGNPSADNALAIPIR